MYDHNGEFQGAMMVLEDVGEKEEITAELKRTKNDFDKLDMKFHDVHTKLKLVNTEISAYDTQIDRISEEKNREIGNISKILDDKQRELENINKNLEEKQESLNFVEQMLAGKQKELEFDTESKGSSQVWKEKLKLYDEIDKSLGISEENSLKTKKLLDDSEEDI